MIGALLTGAAWWARTSPMDAAPPGSRHALTKWGYGVAVLVLGACASLQNTPAQDLAWERWRECSALPGVRLQVISADGEISVWYRMPNELAAWQACEREALARQRPALARVTRPEPTPVVPPASVPAPRPPAPAMIARDLGPADFHAYYRTSWAVVVGIDRYASPRVPRLSYAVADARAVARALPRLGFPENRIVVLENAAATKSAIERAVYGRIAEMDKDDRLFVFFVGHGAVQAIKGGQEGYLLPCDADPANLPLTAMPMGELAQIGRRLPVKHVLFALDNCFSGYAKRRDLVATAEQPEITALAREPVVQLLTAGTEGQRAIEDGGHGIFTKHLLKGLEGWADPDGGGLTALKLASFVQERVLRDSGGQQTPQYAKIEGEGEFVFRPPVR